MVMTRETLTEAIIRVRDAYNARGVADFEIGNGRCENFAQDVMDDWAGDGWILREWQGCAWGTVETGQVCDTEEGAWLWDALEARYGADALLGIDRAVCDRIATLSPNHVWIEHDGLCFDCEHPEGVTSPFGLNFFRRYVDILSPGAGPEA